tara:strand:- start:180 stop:356 length:177 start_codon:yes stop_codon:yes gene_type:complete
MKIYEICFRNGDDPVYVKSKKELKKELEDLDEGTYYIYEKEFEYNLDSICQLCSKVSR